MTNRVFTAIALCMALCFAGAAGAQAPRGEKVEFEKWGFSLDLPSNADKIQFQVDGDTLLSEVYVKGDLAYHIKINSIKSDSLTPTEIEKTIQDVVSAAGDKEVVRWELETRDKRLFKGYNHNVQYDEETLGRMPYLKNILPDGKGVESVAMAQLTDDASPILAISVVGPIKNAMDVATRAKFTAYTVAAMKKAEKKEKNPSKVKPTSPVKPAKTRPQLGKDDIELIGLIESLGKDGKSLVLLVDHIRLPEQKLVTLDPARPKTVLFDKRPEGLRAGKKLLVIGKNEGVGQPITPSYAEPMGKEKPAKQPKALPSP